MQNGTGGILFRELARQMMGMQTSQQEPASEATQDYHQQLKAREEKAEDIELQEPWDHFPGRSWQLCPMGAGTFAVIDCSPGYCLRQRGRRRNTLASPLLCSPVTFQLASIG